MLTAAGKHLFLRHTFTVNAEQHYLYLFAACTALILIIQYTSLNAVPQCFDKNSGRQNLVPFVSSSGVESGLEPVRAGKSYWSVALGNNLSNTLLKTANISTAGRSTVNFGSYSTNNLSTNLCNVT